MTKTNDKKQQDEILTQVLTWIIKSPRRGLKRPYSPVWPFSGEFTLWVTNPAKFG